MHEGADVTMASLGIRVTPGRIGSTDAVELIKQHILSNRLKPGDPMPTEGELADLLGVSRTIVRESIKTLRALDIVEVRHGHGTFVGQLSLEAMVQSLAFRGLLNPKDDQHLLTELVEVRELLETSLASVLATRLPRPDIDALRRIVDVMKAKAEQHEEFLAEDRQFHMMLMEATGNDLVVQLNGAFWDVHAIASDSLGPAFELRASAEAHGAILDAITSGNAQGVRDAIHAHYQPVRERMARAMASTHEERTA